ncbi:MULTISPECIES: hypothetical protein [Nocardiopsis]|uniref:hypothetical protein n=1 Tax=Nocardiopsis TaxID=2013 RepID=UPI0003466F8B|nr:MULTISPECIES: hypothetical protein [Nocardiopsis]
MIGGKILTASAISSWVEGSVYMSALVGVAKRKVVPLHVPALALVQALSGLPGERAEAARGRLDAPVFTFGALGRGEAEAVAHLVTRWQGTGLSPADAHVIWASSAYRGWPVVVAHGAKAWESWLPDVAVEQVP